MAVHPIAGRVVVQFPPRIATQRLTTDVLAARVAVLPQCADHA
jgi:hypothetical protein